MGEDSARPQKSTRSGDESSFAAAFMGRALYDARPMQTQVICVLALMGASTLAAAETPAAQPPTSATTAPAFNGSDDIPNPKGFGDAYSLDEVRIGGEALNETQQIERWQAELAAGRARAGTLVGAFLAYRALTPADCDVARDALTKADELGNDQAPLQLAALSVNPECGPTDRTVTERWLKKAVPLDYPRAAQDLIQLYGNSEVAEDKVQKYLYARVAAGYWDATKASQPRDGFDAQALAEMEKALAPADKARAEAEAAKILEQMMKRRDRFTPVTPVQFTHGDAGSKAGYEAWYSDYRHECQWNLKNNCKGAQRLVYVDLSNKGKDYLSCRLELNAKLFVRHRHELDDGERVPPLDGIEPLLALHGSRWQRSRRFEFGKKLGECHRVKNSRRLKGPLRTLFRPNK